MIKKIGIFAGAFLLFLVLIALILPLVVDVDRYRPQIVEAVNQKINGKLELGKLRLSLWGQVRIEVAGLSVRDVHQEEIFAVKDAYFHLPIASLFSGSPILNFKMDHPVLKIKKDRTGKLNLMTLVKESQPSSSLPIAPTGRPSARPSETERTSITLPALATRARLGVELNHADVLYQDQISGLKSDISDINLILKDISLSHPTEFEMWADLNTKVNNTFSLKGPAHLEGKALPELKDGKILSISLNSHLNMDNVEMSAPGFFEKKRGMATHLDIALVASEAEVRIEKCAAQFFNAELNLAGKITHLTSSSSSPVAHLTLKSNTIDLKPWVELVPLLKEYELGGSIRADGEAAGPTDKLDYRAKLALNQLTAKSPQLKTQPTVDGIIQVVTDQIESLLFTMKAPGNELKVHGKLVSFVNPKLNLTVTSPGMDLDQLIVFPTRSDATSPATGGPAATNSNGAPSKGKSASQGEGKKSIPSADYDAMLSSIRENKILQNFTGNVAIDMKSIKAYQVKLSDIVCKLALKELIVGVPSCNFSVFSGAVKADAHIDLKPKTPTYQFNTQVNHLSLAQAVESQMALFRNTIKGTAHFNISGQGSSFNPEPAISRLKAKGKMKVDQATFATIDVMKMVSDALNKALAQIAEKVPAARGKSVSSLPTHASEYEYISSDFTIERGKFIAPNFYAKSVPNKGIDLKGNATVGIQDYSLDTSWEVIDTYNLTRLRDIHVEESGIKIEHIFAEGGSPVHFPIQISCTIKAPCYSYAEVPSSLLQVALNNIGNALTGRAKEETRKKAEEALRKFAPPEAQQKLKEQLKKIF